MVPLINVLQQKGADVHIGSDGSAGAFLRKELPTLQYHELTRLEITYGRKNMVGALLPQLPAFFKSIKKDNKMLAALHQLHQFDLVISDNRYGCYLEFVPSVLVTHQLNIQAPKMAKPFINKVLQEWCRPFSEIWCPDYLGQQSLAGDLIKTRSLKKIKYLGPLSRLGGGEKKETGSIVVLLSGPEPQRSLLEAKLIDQLSHSEHKVGFVRGIEKPLDKELSQDKYSNIEFINIATAKELEPLLNNAEKIICRSGYSTLMDIAQIGGSLLLIPTPGQTEQEYLAKYFAKRGWANTQSQTKLSLNNFLQKENTMTRLPIIKQDFNLWAEAVQEIFN